MAKQARYTAFGYARYTAFGYFFRPWKCLNILLQPMNWSVLHLFFFLRYSLTQQILVSATMSLKS